MCFQPGKPLFVSMLIYLDDDWPIEQHAETLAIDFDTDTGVFVRPRPGRVVLMDQVPHSCHSFAPSLTSICRLH